VFELFEAADGPEEVFVGAPLLQVLLIVHVLAHTRAVPLLLLLPRELLDHVELRASHLHVAAEGGRGLTAVGGTAGEHLRGAEGRVLKGALQLQVRLGHGG